MRILFIGDIVGQPGRSVLENNLRRLQDEEHIDFTVANGENAAGGFGMDLRCFESIVASGVDAFTMGNHTFDNKGILSFIDREERIIRPLNLPADAPGRGYFTYTLPKGQRLTLVNLMGRIYNNTPLSCPFQTLDHLLQEIKLKDSAILVDFHGDATSEKVCFAHYINGRVSAVLGTHTHIQTADARILSRGTAYITDAGMTGAYDSCLGMDKEAAIAKFTNTVTKRLKPAAGERQINGIVVEMDAYNRATNIKRIQEIFPAAL